MSSYLRSGLLVSFLGLAGLSCAGPATQPSTAASPVVYGQDDRHDYYDEPDELWRARTRESIVALIPPRRIDVSNADDVRIKAGALVEEEGLCSDQRFLTQPTAASCSGTLIDDDLVLTAGHCATNTADCQTYQYVFGYFYEAPGNMTRLTARDVFTCRRVVVQKLTGNPRIDYAIIQLDRPATPRFNPAPVERLVAPLREGTPLTMIGFASGLPAKLDHGGRVLNGRQAAFDYFEASTDSFSSNSGSGVFNEHARVVGILVRGENDYVQRGSCNVVNVLPEGGTPDLFEEITYAHHAVQALCTSGFQSSRLCGPAPTCGDHLCELPETPASCPADCTYTCGNGICEPGETYSCPADCSAPALDGGLPPAWTCSPSYFAAGDGCDCGCGARDPDCDDPAQQLLNCSAGQVCGRTGRCASADGGALDGGALDGGARPDGGASDGGLASDGGPANDAGAPLLDGGTAADAGAGVTDGGDIADGGASPGGAGGGCSSAGAAGTSGGGAGAIAACWLVLLALSRRRGAARR